MEGTLYIINNYIVPAAMILSGLFCFVLLFFHRNEGRTRKVTLFLLVGIAVLAMLIFILEIPILVWEWGYDRQNSITIVILCIAGFVTLLCTWILGYLKGVHFELENKDEEDEQD